MSLCSAAFNLRIRGRSAGKPTRRPESASCGTLDPPIPAPASASHSSKKVLFWTSVKRTEAPVCSRTKKDCFSPRTAFRQTGRAVHDLRRQPCPSTWTSLSCRKKTRRGRVARATSPRSDRLRAPARLRLAPRGMLVLLLRRRTANCRLRLRRTRRRRSSWGFVSLLGSVSARAAALCLPAASPC